MSRLEVDLGNTAFKWRQLDADGAVLARGRCLHTEQDYQAGFVGVPEQVYIASVAPLELIENMKQLLDLPKTVQFHRIKTTNSLACVSNGYRDITRLGVDRWLALCAAYKKANAADRCEKVAVLVVDCGSAITVDFVEAQGQHLGGYILPGLTMMLTSLSLGTADVGAHQIAKVLTPGEITEEAVGHGVVFSAVALIEKAIRQAEEKMAGSLMVYLTGGDARVLLPHLPANIDYQADLVLDGISCYWQK